MQENGSEFCSEPFHGTSVLRVRLRLSGSAGVGRLTVCPGSTQRGLAAPWRGRKSFYLRECLLMPKNTPEGV